MAERVVEFGDVRYEYVDGHWWPDVTRQERVLVEELERQQKGMRQLLARMYRLADTLDHISRLAVDDTVSDAALRGWITGETAE